MMYIKNLTPFFLALTTLLFSCENTKENTPVNVVFIVVDDLNNTIGCYDHPTVNTPNIDKLASQGILFQNAYCNFAVCNPSRSSFLTGLRPQTLGILDNRSPLREVLGDRITMPALFRQNGYHTINIGKVFNGSTDENDPNAWDEEYRFGTTELGRQGVGRNMSQDKLAWCRWLEAEGTDEDQQDGQTAAKAIEFLKRDHDKPFFLALGFAKPHDPFNAPKKYFESYPLEVCTPPALPVDWEPPYEHTLPGQTSIFNNFTDQDKREFLRSYYACTSFIDAQLGKIMDAMEEKGLMENTLIVFFGDHGYHLGEHNWWNKVTVYEKCHNAPLIIVNGDAAVAGRKTDAMVEFLDFYPTISSYCGLNGIPEYLEGKSFENLLRNPDASFRDHVNISTLRGEFKGRSVKTREWRYTEWDDGNMGTELYDELNDPLEYYNLSGLEGYDSIQEQMKSLIIKP
ncbi:sulfatase [Bacteroidota bacterium]